jgi:WD40 repeat protein
MLARARAGEPVQLLDARTGREIRRLGRKGERVRSLVFCADGTRLAAIYGDRGVRLWDTATGKQLRHRTWDQQVVTNVVFAPDGHLLVGTYPDQPWEEKTSAKLWDVSSPRPLLESPVPLVGPLCPRGEHLATWAGPGPCGVGLLWLWRVRSGTRVELFGDTLHIRRPPTFASDGRTVAAVWGPDAESPRAELWDVATHKRLATVRLMAATEQVVFSPDGKKLAVVGSPRCLLLEARRPAVPGESWSAVTLSGDGKLLAVGDARGSVVVWDTTGPTRRYHLPRHTQPVQALTFSRDSRTLASASGDGKICLWDAARGRPGWQLGTVVGDVQTLDFLPDGKTLQAGVLDESAPGERPVLPTTRWWDTASGKEVNPIADLLKRNKDD